MLIFLFQSTPNPGQNMKPISNFKNWKDYEPFSNIFVGNFYRPNVLKFVFLRTIFSLSLHVKPTFPFNDYFYRAYFLSLKTC